MNPVYHDNAAADFDGIIVRQSSLYIGFAPDVKITELSSFVNANKEEMAVVEFSVSNFTVANGILSWIEVLYKSYSHNDFKLINSVSPVYADPAYVNEFTFRVSFPLLDKGVNHTFQLKFKDTNGLVGLFGSQEDAIVEKTALIDGISDLEELYEVRDLAVLNGTSSENGAIASLIANLQWEDVRQIQRGFLPQQFKSGADGVARNLTYEELQRVIGYEVYMYVASSNNPPTNHYPVHHVSDVGTWYYVGEVNVAEMKVRCPATKYVAFWVGMKTARTQSTIVKNILQY